MAPRVTLAGPPVNPFLQVLYLIVGVVLLVGAIFMGAIVLAAVFGLALIFGIVFWIRLWWLRRKFRRAARASGIDPGTFGAGQSGRDGGGVEITGVEYTVVRETRQNDEQD